MSQFQKLHQHIWLITKSSLDSNSDFYSLLICIANL